MNQKEKLKEKIDEDARRIRKAEKEKSLLLGQTVYLGTLGVMLVLPIVGGAYLGRWLDGRLTGFSFSWTITLILLGVFSGATSAYLFIRRNE